MENVVSFYEQEFYKKEFTGPTMKTAYMSAVKWIATNVISNEEFCDVSFRFEKSRKSPSIVVHLYAVLNESEIERNNCTICRESHSSFFMNDVVNCSECKVKAYQKRLDNFLKNKRLYYKELLNKTIRKKEDK